MNGLFLTISARQRWMEMVQSCHRMEVGGKENGGLTPLEWARHKLKTVL